VFGAGNVEASDVFCREGGLGYAIRDAQNLTKSVAMGRLGSRVRNGVWAGLGYAMG
jgi:hypothetical protein